MVDCNRLIKPAVRAIALNPCKRVILRRSNLVEGESRWFLRFLAGAKIPVKVSERCPPCQISWEVGYEHGMEIQEC